MPRNARIEPGEVIFHVLNCGVGRTGAFKRVGSRRVKDFAIRLATPSDFPTDMIKSRLYATRSRTDFEEFWQTCGAHCPSDNSVLNVQKSDFRGGCFLLA